MSHESIACRKGREWRDCIVLVRYGFLNFDVCVVKFNVNKVIVENHINYVLNVSADICL